MQTYALFGPPGTGKTTEMLRLIADAKNRGFQPDDIGFFSFTRAAANEALKRLGITRSDKICTLHSWAFRAAGASPMQMVDGFKLRKFGASAGIEFSGAQSDEFGDQMGVGDKYLAIYNLARSRLTSHEDEYYDSDERPGDFAQYKHCIESYENWKTAFGYLDFTDLIEMYVKNPRNHHARVLFVDEAQDLSPLQWQMVDRMCEFTQVLEVTIAGDDDQAIFEWSGADPHGMAKFLERTAGELQTLKQSYRVPVAVHEVARGIVATIENRVKKSYRAAPRDGIVTRTATGFSQALVSHGDDVLVLVRSGTQRKEVEEELIAHRVPYRTEGGKPGLFDSMWADAIRLKHRMASGHVPSTAEAELLFKAASPVGKKQLGDQNWAGYCALSDERAVAIPPQFIEFFREADLTQTPTIRLSTIHAAKGREARRVVLHTGITARVEMGMEHNADAEARVFYVGVTRAKEELEIVSGYDRSYSV